MRGERRDGVEGIVAGGDGGGQEDQATRAHLFFPGGDGLQDHLRAFERQAAGLDQAERGQRLFAVGEDLADQVAHAAQVAGAGDEGANLEHGVGAGFAGEGFEGVAHLGGKQAAGGEGGDVEGEAAGFAGDGSRQFLGELQGLGDFFLLGLGFFLRGHARSQDEAAGRRHERQPSDGALAGSRCLSMALGCGPVSWAGLLRSGARAAFARARIRIVANEDLIAAVRRHPREGNHGCAPD